jgi:hypothetical protein
VASEQRRAEPARPGLGERRGRGRQGRRRHHQVSAIACTSQSVSLGELCMIACG